MPSLLHGPAPPSLLHASVYERLQLLACILTKFDLLNAH